MLGRRHASLARDDFFAAAVTRPWGLHVSLASLCSRNALAMLDWLQSALFLVDKARRAEGDEEGADRLHSDELLTQRTQILVGMSIATRKSNGAEGEAYVTSPHFTLPHFTSPHLTSPHLTSLHFTSLTLSLPLPLAPHLTSLPAEHCT